MMRFSFLVVLCVFLFTDATAQRRYMEVAAQYAMPEAYREAVVLPHGRVQVLFRIPHARLIFLRTHGTGQGPLFEASFSVTASVYQKNQRVAERTWHGKKRVSSFEATRDRNQDVEGSLPLRLEPGHYLLRLTVQDEHADAPWFLPPARLDIPADSSLSSPFFVFPPSKEVVPLTLTPVNLSGQVPLGQSVRAALWIPLDVRTIIYQLERLPTLPREKPSRRTHRRRKSSFYRLPSSSTYASVPGESLFQDTLQAAAFIPFDSLTWSETEPLHLSIQRSATPEYTLALLDLKSETLEDGVYRLTVEAREAHGTRTGTYVFTTHWRNMPLSLRDLDLAIENLRFLVDRKTLKAFKKGSREKKEARFRAFWKERDPTPNTPFNELMAEYYRRIDYAAWAFRTGNAPVPNGLETDRARVYIRFGAPASIKRTLKEKGSGVREVWHYPDGRVFVFEASSSLDPFILVATREEQ